MQYHTLQHSAAFQSVSKSPHLHHGTYMVVRCLHNPPCTAPTPHIGIGIIASRKVGNAVKRNRAKRRLRAITREIMPHIYSKDTAHIVIVARNSLPLAPFADLKNDLMHAYAQFGFRTQERA